MLALVRAPGLAGCNMVFVDQGFRYVLIDTTNGQGLAERDRLLTTKFSAPVRRKCHL